VLKNIGIKVCKWKVHYSQEVIVVPFSACVAYPSSRCQVQTLVVTESESNVFLCNRFARNASTLFEKVVQMDRISSRLTRCHRRPTRGVGRFFPHFSICARERVHSFSPPEHQVAARITAQLARPETHTRSDSIPRPS